MKFGDKVDASKITKGAPPVVLQLQPTGYVKMTTPEEIRDFEAIMQEAYGHKLSIHSSMHACETCSGGCSDDCGMMM